MLPFESHLEGVLTVYFGDVIGELKGRADLVRGQEVIAAQSGQTADGECRKPAVQFALRNVRNVILRWNAVRRGLGARTRGVQVIQADTHLIDQCWRKRVG